MRIPSGIFGAVKLMKFQQYSFTLGSLYDIAYLVFNISALAGILL